MARHRRVKAEVRGGVAIPARDQDRSFPAPRQKSENRAEDRAMPADEGQGSFRFERPDPGKLRLETTWCHRRSAPVGIGCEPWLEISSRLNDCGHFRERCPARFPAQRRSLRSRNSTAGTYPRPQNRGSGCASFMGLEFCAHVGVDFATENDFLENRTGPDHNVSPLAFEIFARRAL